TTTNEDHAQLKLVNDAKVKPDIVFVGILKWCKSEAMKCLSKEKWKPQEENIQWVLTVPAIWDETAKGLMRQWAQQAKIWSPSTPSQLIIALEPECASIAMMLEMENNPNKVQFQKGDCYMMMDLGAGTADMVCHEITGPFEVKEMIASFGGPWGSSYIDQDVLKIFDEFFGKDDMQKFRKEYRSAYLDLLFNIEKSKCRFFQNEEIDGTNNIQIPSEFYNFTKNKIKELKVSISNCKYQNESGFDSVNIFIYSYCFFFFFFFFFV
ncbi:hypothetical protein RFI_33963, partial [Reticulomyxa filosa]